MPMIQFSLSRLFTVVTFFAALFAAVFSRDDAVRVTAISFVAIVSWFGLIAVSSWLWFGAEKNISTLSATFWRVAAVFMFLICLVALGELLRPDIH
jgi:hypothetical protein